MSNSLPIHSSLESTTLSAKIGEVAIHSKWKQTANQTRKERGIVVPLECVKAPEVPESFRALVESVLLNQAQEVLKAFVDASPDVWEVPSDLFSRPSLIQSATEGKSSSNWMSKEELELSFTSSATWKRISGRSEFQSNKTYQLAAGVFRDAILKLSGKSVKMTPEKCDAILSKLEDSDLTTPFGEFVAGRLAKLKSSQEEGFDLSAL